MRSAVRRAVALLIGSLLLLAGCGGEQAGDLPQVSGEFGKKPTVTLPKGEPGKEFQVKTLIEGNGPEVKKGDILFAHFLLKKWQGDEELDATYDSNQLFATPTPIGTGQLLKAWDEGLVGKKVGSRVLMVVPPEKGYGANPPQGSPIKPDDTLVYVIDVYGSYPPSASVTGQPTGRTDPKLPTVQAQPGRKPVIKLPSRAAPKQLVSQVLVEGTGPEVKAGQFLIGQYVGVIWPGGKEFDASWNRQQPAAFQIGTGQVIKGWDEGLVGKKAGSRVLLVIPPDKGYGTSGRPEVGIKGTDTLVFVVDILGSR